MCWSGKFLVDYFSYKLIDKPKSNFQVPDPVQSNFSPKSSNLESELDSLQL